MFKIRKTLFFSLIPVVLSLTLTSISCSNNKFPGSSHFSIKRDEKKNKWNKFVEREYVNQILEIVYNGDKEKIKKYKEEQYNINDKQIINDLDKYLSYANNVKAGYGSDDDCFNCDGPYPVRKFSSKISSIFSKNWLWILFNLDKFNFVLYDVFDQFSGNVSTLSDEAQKNAVNHGLFRKIHSNDIAQFALETSVSKATNNIYNNFYLLTDDWNILEIKLETNHKRLTTSVTLVAYINTYPKLTKNKLDREVFVLDEYVKAKISVSNKRTSTAMDIFNAKFGGKPLRYTIFEINSKYLNK
ncbi:hypothetical protein FOY66_04180 [Mycoplasma capricolum subsp. capripneumoniae]|uniref:Lipoprotein n=1 Tax=Mycoplasma capricolum subsp. capripneumoniae 87001 TaxID=1124992 RepID=A0A9N7ATF1_MYCCC|nr:aromatic motif membrane protein [Mycoplasma capricolum]AJK51826.1 lipoprotein [Mycoplasma capricolum subsp. capripneumoniae 87001]AOQ22422.1 hypothetical protein M1601_04155 [Mycoplasma capricolum subsp. capripneumoniae M1601]KEY84767.1 hypothetical protein MCCP_0370 [Mycoplasma capricolum subsp. capripneumoniae 99108]QDL19882.1 hypothetical protein DQW15_04215 [Mycoplasma capricolum subsp. capripneumoniae]QDL20567.1 hypothetical protein DQW16_04215 [Mycoplasma capricolum subsp. capripneumo